MQTLAESYFTYPTTNGVACKMEAHLEYVHILYTLFARLGANLHAQSLLINKISALEHRKFIKGPLLVGYLLP